MSEAFIVAAVRTAGARKGGRLSGWHPADLAASVLDALVARTGIDPALIDDVIMGCVGQAGEQSNKVPATCTRIRTPSQSRHVDSRRAIVAKGCILRRRP